MNILFLSLCAANFAFAAFALWKGVWIWPFNFAVGTGMAMTFYVVEYLLA